MTTGDDRAAARAALERAIAALVAGRPLAAAERPSASARYMAGVVWRDLARAGFQIGPAPPFPNH